MDTNAIALGAEAQGPGSDATAACNSFAAQPPHQSHPHKPRLPPHGSDARRAYIASNKGMTRHGSYSGPAPFGGLRLSVSCTGEGPWSPPQHEAASPGASSVDFLDTPVDMSGLVRERTPKVKRMECLLMSPTRRNSKKPNTVFNWSYDGSSGNGSATSGGSSGPVPGGLVSAVSLPASFMVATASGTFAPRSSGRQDAAPHTPRGSGRASAASTPSPLGLGSGTGVAAAMGGLCVNTPTAVRQLQLERQGDGPVAPKSG